MIAPRQRTARPLILATLGAALSGCGDPPDITGLYETTEHAASASDCTGASAEPVDPAQSPPYFRIEEEDFFGTTVRSMSACQSTDPADCSGGGGLLVEETDEGYRGWISFQSGDASSCTLGYIHYQASLDGDTLAFVTATHSDSGAIDPCTTEEAERRGTDMACGGYERLTGTLVPE